MPAVKVKVINRDPHWYSRRIKEGIRIRLYPNNINRDSGMEIAEEQMPTKEGRNFSSEQSNNAGS